IQGKIGRRKQTQLTSMRLSPDNRRVYLVCFLLEDLSPAFGWSVIENKADPEAHRFDRMKMEVIHTRQGLSRQARGIEIRDRIILAIQHVEYFSLNAQRPADLIAQHCRQQNGAIRAAGIVLIQCARAEI